MKIILTYSKKIKLGTILNLVVEFEKISQRIAIYAKYKRNSI